MTNPEEVFQRLYSFWKTPFGVCWGTADFDPECADATLGFVRQPRSGWGGSLLVKLTFVVYE